MVFVWYAKLPDPSDPCPIMPVDIWGWLAFTQCEEGKPRPRLQSNIIELPWGPIDYYKGFWFFYSFIQVTGMTPGYYDAVFVNSWDGPEIFPIDDACGINFWESEIFPLEKGLAITDTGKIHFFSRAGQYQKSVLNNLFRRRPVHFLDQTRFVYSPIFRREMPVCLS